jgi:hypothetical protein
MNISTSTGGPHILLFERDQQLATLLISELQLAGYTNHVARTAVEVFDAIARHPVRIILVNLAQAAAARREFWVALDAQRRDRKVQVLTFHCTNLASYGPKDAEDYAQSSMADMEVDGMLGLMSLVDAIRTRVPQAATEASPNSLSRLSKTTGSTPSPAAQRPPTPQTQNPVPDSNNSFRTIVPSDSGAITPNYRSDAQTLQQQPRSFAHPATPPNSPTTSPFANQAPIQSPPTGLSGSNQPTYSEKIRAVLYPNQRTWNASNADTPMATQDGGNEPGDMPNQSVTNNVSTPATPESTVLQQLANGQLNANTSTSGESGLAQLSRMAQGFLTPSPNEPQTQNTFTNRISPAQTAIPQPPQTPRTPSAPPIQKPIVPTPPTQTAAAPTENPWSLPAGASYSSLERKSVADSFQAPTQQVENTTAASSTNHPTPNANAAQTQVGQNASPEIVQEQELQIPKYTPYSPPAVRPSQSEEAIRVQPLRASPIQDMPIERTVTGPAITETNKRAETHVRPSLLQQQAQTQAQTQQAPAQPASPLASIVTPMPPVQITQAKTVQTPPPLPPQMEVQPKQENHSETSARSANTEPVENPREKAKPTAMPLTREEIQHKAEELAEDIDENIITDNALLLDIVQSLPPMPAITQSQTVQAQVLNGRATRSLNKVLLDGHLVPQDRLEVAQNIQRMLRGVDLNYQLGEILLMFKLLTPDQLLAASLVSYGLITTTQISALGRIRQELHAIGLEYDLENLLVLFRILTPEQLREVRTSMQS